MKTELEEEEEKNSSVIYFSSFSQVHTIFKVTYNARCLCRNEEEKKMKSASTII